jgi:hypothetical protein
MKQSIQKNQMEWYFPSTGHGEDSGFADSLLQYFEGDHEKFIAREAIQNAVDARLNYDKPVSVVFERLEMPIKILPDFASIKNVFSRCLAFVKNQEKAENFFKASIALLKGKRISILKISDFNTKGLSGSDNDSEGNWYRLVRATGTSSPKGVAGGSYGIGKGAPIAASGLRMVFYSSINESGEPVFQGKARLVSHHDKNEDVRQGVGFYGINGYKAVRSDDLIPSFFRRSKQGTDIFIIGYRSANGWKDKLIKSILHNFWLAILHGDLEVAVKDGSEKIITRDNLHECLEKYDAEDAKFYFESITSWTQKFEQELKHLGKTSLFVRKQDGYPGRIMMARKPKMLVQEKNYRVLREPYAGVLLCENDRGNNLLRELEPVAHDKWDKDRAEKGPAALRELDAFIKQSLKSMNEAITSEPEDIPGLDKYLPDSEDRDYLPHDDAGVTDSTELFGNEESGREVGATKEPDSTDAEMVTRKGIVTNKTAEPARPTPPKGPGQGSRGRGTGPEDGKTDGVRIKTSNIAFRSFAQKKKNGLEYHFAITGREDCEGAIRLVAVGDDGSYPVDLRSAVDVRSGKPYEVSDSMIRGLSVESGKTLRLAVRLASDKKYSLGIENYED